MKPAATSRKALVAEVRTRLLAEGSPRLTMLVIVSLAGCTAFLVAVIALEYGLRSMTVRYAIAAIAGYLAFGLLVRGWIAWRRRQLTEAANWVDVVPPIDVGKAADRGWSGLFAGGRSGGGGATASWQAVPGESSAPVVLPVPAQSRAATSGNGSGGKWADALDGDNKLWAVALALVLALAAFIAVGFVVYSAPTMLAEVAIDAGLMSGVYRRMASHEAGHWTGAVWRHTWQPALLIVACAAAAGFALQAVAPEAQSIGGVIRSLTESSN